MKEELEFNQSIKWFYLLLFHSIANPLSNRQPFNPLNSFPLQ